MNDNLTERLLELISAERSASAHQCDTRVDFALIRQLGRGDIAGARRSMESAATALHAAQHALTDELLGGGPMTNTPALRRSARPWPPLARQH